MSNSSKSLEEQVKARIANCRRSQEMFLHEFREGLIDEEHYKEFYGRINLRIDELEQVLSMIEEKAKEIKERLDVTNNTPYSAQNPAIIAGRAQAYSDALALLISQNDQ